MNYPRIRELRLLHNLKQEFVADHLNISQPEYSRLENGLREPRVEDFQCLSKLYGVKPSAFMPEQGLSEPYNTGGGTLKRVGVNIPQAPYWVNVLENHQQMMASLIESQQRTEQLFDRLINLLSNKQIN